MLGDVPSQIVGRRGKITVQLEDLFIKFVCFAVVFLAVVDHRDVHTRFDRFWRAFDRFEICRDRLIKGLLPGVEVTDLEISGNQVRVDR